MRSVLPLERQYQLFDESLINRVQNLLPELMKRTGIDMWITACREYNEDPMFRTLVPALTRTSGRIAVLVFALDADGVVHPISLGRPNGQIQRIYERCWMHRDEPQKDAFQRILREYEPRKIGLNMSKVGAITDGLSKTMYDMLLELIGEQYSDRIVSSYPLATAWLETRTEQELARYRSVYALAMDIIDEAYSSAVITPGLTTTTDVEWFIMTEINKLGLDAWFTPTIDLQRRGFENSRIESEIILPGDILHCDVGLTYFGLCTDTQRIAYVPCEGEEDMPSYLKKVIETGNRFQNIVAENFIEGRTGNEILAASLAQAGREGIKATLYTHPIGFNGHAAGPTIGLWDNQNSIEGAGEYPLFKNTCYALELNTCQNVPEWDNQEVYAYLEETVAFTENGRLDYMYDRRRCVTIVR